MSDVPKFSIPPNKTVFIYQFSYNYLENIFFYCNFAALWLDCCNEYETIKSYVYVRKRI